MLRAEELTVTLGAFTLGPIDVDLRSGAITCVIGPNAAGKTTLLGLLAGVRRPDGGRVLLDGQALSTVPRPLRARRCAHVGHMSGGGLMSVESLVALGRLRLGRDQGRVDDSIEAMGLRDERRRLVSSLSAGQQHRAHLARAMAQVDPTGLLVLDEPTADLDPDHALGVWRLLRRFVNGGGTVLVSMHDLPAAGAVADDVWLLQEGRLIEAGEASTLLDPARLESLYGIAFARTTPGDLPLPAWMLEGNASH
ncbi:MAG: ABC transporter ATP-binding protein [Phycisphaerales bacterium]|nr:ABC transporter ATP-binding protein [Phycisphaerales bacterium]